MQPGASLNHYRIVGELGAGGMGRVFRARDTRLNRDVAIKVLPPELARDAERLVRMEREAQVLAALNHPHVAAIYGLEEAPGLAGQGTRFLVMELVEGESLADRIAAGPLDPESAIEIARGIAHGLEAAHEKGIVHRDLKPANVMLAADGAVKVLDFGLAKAYDADGTPSSPELSASPTILGTQAGVILGTASYMSPEQARGRPLDKRTDVWAFGCVLFEMLGGRRPFDGETVTDIIAAVVRAEPAVDDLPTGTPPRLRELVRRCLVKDPLQRLRDIGDARIELDRVYDDDVPEARPATVVPAPSGFRPAWLAAALAVGALTALAVMTLFRSEPAPPPVRQAILVTEGAQPINVAATPAGDAVVYGTIDGLRLRRLADAGDALIEGTVGAQSAVFADDETLYYTQAGALKRLDIRAGTAVTVAEPPEMAWAFFALDGGGIAYAMRGQSQMFIDRVNTVDGSSEVVSEWPASEGVFLPVQVIGDGRMLLGMKFSPEAVSGTPAIDDLIVSVVSLVDGARTDLASGYGWPRLVAGGHLLMVDTEQRLVSTRLNGSGLALAGVPVPRLVGLAAAALFVAYDVADDGSLFFVGGDARGGEERSLVWIDRSGKVTAATDKVNYYDTDSSISPDGRYIAVERTDVQHVWIHDLQRNTQSPLYNAGRNTFPVWSPDGRSVALAMWPVEGEHGIFLVPVDRSGPPTRVTTAAAGRFHLPMDWGSSGTIVYADADNAVRAGSDSDLWLVEATAADAAEPRPLLTTPARETEARFSPDGRWIAYQSDHSGREEVYVRAADGRGGEIPVSVDGGRYPSWNPTGGELFYYGGERRFMSLEVETEPMFAPGVPREVWKLPDGYLANLIEPDPGGDRFLTVRQAAADAVRRVQAIFNWAQILDR